MPDIQCHPTSVWTMEGSGRDFTINILVISDTEYAGYPVPPYIYMDYGGYWKGFHHEYPMHYRIPNMPDIQCHTTSLWMDGRLFTVIILVISDTDYAGYPVPPFIYITMEGSGRIFTMNILVTSETDYTEYQMPPYIYID